MADQSSHRAITHFTRLALLAGAALTLAACQTSSGYDAEGNLPSAKPMAKPNFPVRAEIPPAQPTAPPPAPVAATPKPPPPSEAPVSAGLVESKPLAPPPAQVAAAPPPPAPSSQPAPPRMVQVAPAAPAAPIPPPRPSATGVVENASTPSASGAYTVKPGQGLDAIARELGVSRQALIDLNGLSEPYALKVGERLKTPAAGGGPASGKAAVYVVAPGDTLFSIARRFDSTPTEMADLGGLKAGEAIHPGQKIPLPGKYQAQAPVMAPAPQPAAPPVRTAAVTPPPPATPVARPAPPTPAPPAAQVATAQPPASRPAGPPIERSTASAAQVRAAGQGKFVWPVKGRILEGFGPKSDGQRNDGINIAAPMSTSVRAAAAGDVIYAGDVLRDYGNLVLIQHADGFVTAYGYLSKINVKMKDHVSQDQEIGQVGDTGGVTQPQLHFETRYARTSADSPAPPVDPMLVLPNP